MEIIDITPMISNHNGNVRQVAKLIIYDTDILRTVFLPANDTETRIKLQQAINTGKYPEVTSLITETNNLIYLKFKT